MIGTKFSKSVLALLLMVLLATFASAGEKEDLAKKIPKIRWVILSAFPSNTGIMTVWPMIQVQTRWY